ncbi:MAG: division/cell wall cluster transcriptional repressor MraZ [Thermanaerothrix sp.]|nr:division/cell wall cluster transcriptional repressor MraZ [Thermanaerothrix sp.]
MGTYDHRMDSKGRLVLPSRFRDELGDRLIATVGIDSCVSVYGLQGWRSFFERLSSLSSAKAGCRDVKRLLMASAVEIEVDPMGRVLIPSFLREHASLNREISVIGVGDHVEIWDRDLWGARRSQIISELPAIVEGVEGL